MGFCSFQDEIIKVFVGADEKAFTIHKTLICEISPVFDRLFNGNFKEGIEGVAHLQDDEPDTFKDFSHWLYYREIPIEHQSSPDETYLLLVSLFVLADKYKIRRLKNDVTDMMIEYSLSSSKSPAPGTVRLAYSKLPRASKMLRLISDVTAEVLRSYQPSWEAWMKSGKRTALESTPEFAADLFFGMTTAKARGVEARKCTYHEHSEVRTAGRELECT
jgi:hypothetical protein